MATKKLKIFLNEAYQNYHNDHFLAADPLQIPHQFTAKQDIEIMAFFAATLAWGQRKSIINSCLKLVQLFDNQPYNFIINHKEEDLKRFETFVHRTFNATDLLYFIAFLKQHYQREESLETAFSKFLEPQDAHVEKALIGFHQYFCSLPYFPKRTGKHIASPAKKSACKRLNMFLRWMVRKDDLGIDFGLWEQISPAQLLCPLDVHVERQARILGLITRPKSDFLTVLELTQNLKKFDAKDPVKFDFALFGLGAC
jgi:uncharacterized protein (TIGR02757 family)